MMLMTLLLVLVLVVGWHRMLLVVIVSLLLSVKASTVALWLNANTQTTVTMSVSDYTHCGRRFTSRTGSIPWWTGIHCRIFSNTDIHTVRLRYPDTDTNSHSAYAIS
jgi:carbohydrate-selective porin OprB